ncbi:MAG: amidohydrolase family protein, partial [Acidobacteria bacterium]|nr:amidohydrolase family protein [Acidobacteriota bacterium]
FLSLGAAGPQSGELPSEIVHYADTVLHNGQVLVADDQFTIVEALAIRDGKVLAIGPSSKILKMAGPQTRRIDLAGKTVVPGFIDTHLHSAWVGNTAKSGLPLKHTNKEEFLQGVRSYVEKAKPGEWVMLKARRDTSYYTVTRHDLDPFSPNNPVVIVNNSQEYVANTRALEIAKIPHDTPGYIKDEKGEPTGQLGTWASGIISYEARPWLDLDKAMAEQKEVFRKLLSVGLTTVGGRAEGQSITILNTLRRRGELPLRVRFAPELLRLNPAGEVILKRLGNLMDFGDDQMKIVGLTLQSVDGVISEGNSMTWQPKRQTIDERDPFTTNGQWKWEMFGPIKLNLPREKTEWMNVMLANRYGWNITSMHSVGDWSNSKTLSTYAEANKEKPLQGTWGIDHGPMLNAEHIDLMKELGVVPSYYMLAIGRNPDTAIKLYGADAVHRMTQVKSAIASGIRPVAEADTLVDPFVRPLWNIEKYITRRDEKGRVWGSDQKISREQALWMYTNWGAQYHEDQSKLGTLEPGKLADLAVLNGDYLKVPEEQISDIPVVLTMVGGKIVYEGDGKPIQLKAEDNP